MPPSGYNRQIDPDGGSLYTQVYKAGRSRWRQRNEIFKFIKQIAMATSSYVVRKKLDKSGEQTITRYYGIPVTYGQIDEDYLAREICSRCSLTEGDVLAAVSALSDAMQKHLSNGCTVSLKGIGLFSVSASSKGCDTPEACTPAKVKAQRVCFKADPWMRSILPEIKYKRVNRKKTK